MKVLFIFLLLPFVSSAQKDYPAMLDAYMQGEVSINNFNGNVLVAKSGHIIYQKAFGYRNYLTKEPLDNNSVFELQSITKEFTAVAILQLVEKGKLSLKDTLRKFFPELPYSNVTIQHMLTHTSGLPDDLEALEPNWNHKNIATNNDVVKILAGKKIPQNFKPGEKWEYSNTAFELLASIVEKLSGLTYEGYIQKYMLTPLKMNNSFASTSLTRPKETIQNYAYGFIFSDSLKGYILPESIPETDFVFFQQGTFGAGNILSTTGDLLKWDRAIKQHALLTETMQKTMLSPQSTMDTILKKYYGYGMMLGSNEIGDYVMHGGGWPGYHTMLFRYVADDITIIVLSNNESNSTRICGPLAYLVTDRLVVVPYIHKIINIDSALLNNYTGRYNVAYVPIPARVELVKKGDKLMCRFATDTAAKELKPESNKKFFLENSDIQIEFEIDGLGKAVKSYLIYNNMKKEMTKLE